jgi:hypothetical protein
MSRASVAAAVMMIGALAACGGSDDPDPQAPERAEATRAAATETFPLIGEAVEALTYSGSGGGRWAVCGMEPSPSGAEYVAEIAIVQTNVGASTYPAGIETALTSAGWTVEEPTAEALEATKDDLRLRARYGDGGINLAIRSGCVDLSEDAVRELTDQPVDDLGVPAPS